MLNTYDNVEGVENVENVKEDRSAPSHLYIDAKIINFVV